MQSAHAIFLWRILHRHQHRYGEIYFALANIIWVGREHMTEIIFKWRRCSVVENIMTTAAFLLKLLIGATWPLAQCVGVRSVQSEPIARSRAAYDAAPL
jgi:hypothetical protein